MAPSTSALRSLTAVIDYALLPSSDSTVSELQTGDEHDLGAKLNSFRKVASVEDYKEALAYLWVRFEDLKSTILIALGRFRDIRNALPLDQNIEHLRRGIDHWSLFQMYDKAEDEVNMTGMPRDLQRLVIIRAIVRGVCKFKLQRVHKRKLWEFVSKLADSTSNSKWDCDPNDYLPVNNPDMQGTVQQPMPG